MLKFYLPDFFYFFDLNMALINLLKQNPEYFYDNIEIGAVYGTYPGAIWNGGRCFLGSTDMNCIINTTAAYNNLGIPIRHTFTNLVLRPEHVYDTYCNLIMRLTSNGKNEVLVNYDVLESYLREKYPNNNFISSTTKCIQDVDSFNKELEQEYSLVVLDFRKNTDLDFISQINDISRVELLINAYCSPDCQKRKEHYAYLSDCQLNCKNAAEYCNILSRSFYDALKLSSVIKVQDLYSKYVDLGFRHFKIEGRTNHPVDVIDSYVYYMVQPEYVDVVRNILLKSIWRF